MKTKLSLICAWMLMSCMQPSREAGQDDPSTEFGNASLILPAFTPSALAKAGQKLGTFTLEIAGTGMAPMNLTYPLDSLDGKPVLISRIPAGARRVFTGRLLDPQGAITHEGSSPAAIEPGKTAQVHLVLRMTNTGNATICVEVEGLPPPANCTKPPDSVKVAGCWTLSDAFGGVARMEFFALARNGYMGQVLRPDGTVEPITTWSQANGALTFIVVGPGGLKRIYTGKFDLPSTNLNGVRGQATDAVTGKILGEWKAYPTACAPAPVVTNCWKIVKTSMDCVRMRGAIKMTRTGSQVRGNMMYRTGMYSLQGQVEGGSLKLLAVSDRILDSMEFVSQTLAGTERMSGKYHAIGRTELGVWSAVVDSACLFIPAPDEKACPGDPE